MDQDGHPDLSHGSLAYQNNNFTHSNTVTTLSANYPNSGDRSHLQQQYSGNSSQPLQHSLTNQSQDPPLCTSELSNSVTGPHCSSISPQSTACNNSRPTPPQGSVYMTAQSCQSLNTYSEVNKAPAQPFYSVNTPTASSGQGSIPSSYVQHPHSQATPSAASRFNTQTYSSPMTNSSLQTSQTSGSSSTTDLEKRQLIQQQLLLLLHAQCCRQEQAHSAPCTTPHCRTMRNVLQHMKTCTEGKNCRKPHCASSRQIISHWKNCSSRECPVCEPLKRGHSRAPPQRQTGSVAVQPSQANEVNGVATTPSPAVVRSPMPQNIRRSAPLSTPTTTPTQVRMSGAYPQTMPNVSPASSMSQGSSGSTDQTDWRAGVNQEHRDHVVRRIVKYILPQPDPAAYSDPRMANLIEYARKVENAMYVAAKDRAEYFHLLSERCYKIYKELEEARRRRRSAASVSSNNTTPTSTLPSDPGTGSNRVVNSSGSSFSVNSTEPLKPTPAKIPLSNSTEFRPANTNSVVDVKPEACSKSCGTFKKEEDGKSFTPDMSQSSVTGNDVKKPSVKSEDSLQSVGSLSSGGALGSGVDGSKVDESKWKKWSREELLRHFLRLHEEVYSDKNAEWFRDPVDPVALHIPDYPEVIKHPMDLTTIRNNLEDGVYKDPWEVLDHFRLMFNNAWLYNKKNSKVYKMCTKLSELFESQVDQVMQAMGFCCGHEYSYQQILYCSSSNVCTIGKDACYYMYTNTDKRVLICDNYYQCEKCFNEAGDEIMLADEANQTPVPIRKELFKRKKNNVTIDEIDVYCKECGRRWHKVCALHMDEIWPTGFICPGCLRERGQRRKENRFTAKNLPTNKLSNFLERRVNNFLKKKEVGTGEVTIRVLASSDKLVEVKPLMRGRFTESGELSESFPYRLKAIFAFQEIDGQDVCFFGLYIQEYGSESPQPNRRRVYVAYLDSVFYFRPKQYRTDVYHEILVGYLHYAKQLGYTMAHIWACPPGEGDDYIFHMHPAEQKIPKAKRLQDWYKRMLQKAMIEGIVVDFKDILKDAIDHHLVSPTEIPYFEGDFWPNTLEEILQDLDKEEERRRREEAMAETEDDDPDGSRDRDGSLGDLDKRSGKKRAKKRKCSKKAGGSAVNKRKKLDGPVDCNTELTRKVYDTMEKLKEIFFVIRLHRNGATASLPPIVDPDALISSELMDSRDSFLQMAREKHLEFSSLRRAKYSTLVMLYELHNEARQSFLYTCNVCKAQIVTRWHCNECDEYDLCNRCYRRENHPHPMEPYGLGIEEEGSSTNGETSGERPAGTVDRKANFEPCIRALVHACQCRDANCRVPTCVQMKRVLGHTRSCLKRSTGSCALCRQLFSICCLHAKSCSDGQCQVPLCPQLKDRFRQQLIQKRRQQNKSLQRRTNLTRGATGTESSVAGSAYHPHYGAQTTPVQASSVPSEISSDVGDSRQVSRTSSFASSDGGRVGGFQSMSVNGGVSVASSPRVIPTPLVTPQTQQVPRLPVSSSQIAWRDGQTASSQQSGQLQQQQTMASASSFRPGGGSGGGTLLAQDISAISGSPTPEQIDQVREVVGLIRTTNAPIEEQNRQFFNWINRHPEYRPAFLALRGRNRQLLSQGQRLAQQQGANQQSPGGQVQSTVNVASLPSSSSSTPSSASGALSYNQTVESLPTSVTSQPKQVALSATAVGQRQFAQQQTQQFTPQLSDQQQQQYVIAQPMRVRTLPGGSAVIQQQVPSQTQHPGDQQWVVTRVRTAPGGGGGPALSGQQHSASQQQIYSNNSPGGVPSSTTVYTTTGGGGTTLLTTIGGPQQTQQHHPQQIISQSRLIPTVTTGGGGGVSGARVAGQPTTVVHFRTATQQQLSQSQPHILVANPVTSTPQQRPIVALMQQPSPQQQQQQQLLKTQQQQQQQQNPPPSSSNPSGSASSPTHTLRRATHPQVDRVVRHPGTRAPLSWFSPANSSSLRVCTATTNLYMSPSPAQSMRVSGPVLSGATKPRHVSSINENLAYPPTHPNVELRPHPPSTANLALASRTTVNTLTATANLSCAL
ncbi:unnamed protein product [Mesocestoides corti]|uniref:histone acetyltransferase n=5 Tax=Mesocestoides corti TaxID=53468 RepID=A0A0R3UNJ6_MESCO|nr:unnamed protein product [Mesocestoides corti]